MNRLLCILAASIGMSLVAHAAAPAQAANAAAGDPAAGERIYRQGLLPTGEPVQAVLQADVPASGRTVACANCHRRSGQGSNEGRSTAPPVTGTALFAPAIKKARRVFRGADAATEGERPAYDAASLARAIREGIDAAGRPLSPLMPRFALDDRAMSDLLAYLHGLSSGNSPGATADTVHLATLVLPGADPQAVRLMLSLLRNYVQAHNAETRHETRRATYAPIQREWQYQGYRKWQLHEWRLQGPPETWPAQLDQLYREQPVFAVLSGIGPAPWGSIHRFCERLRLLCLMPNTELPEIKQPAYYTLYFSRGLFLEADALAVWLARDKKTPQRLLQVHTGSDAGRLAARQLAERLGPAIRTRILPRATDRHAWETLLDGDGNTSLVLWLGPGDDGAAILEALAAAPVPPARLFLHASAWRRLQARPLPHALAGRLYVSWPYDLPSRDRLHLLRPLAWARSRGIEISDEQILMDTYTAMLIAADAIRHVRSFLVRDYVMEILEHMADNAVVTGRFPRLSLGPGQRFASKGCYILRAKPGRNDGTRVEMELEAVSDWLVP